MGANWERHRTPEIQRQIQRQNHRRTHRGGSLLEGLGRLERAAAAGLERWAAEVARAAPAHAAGAANLAAHLGLAMPDLDTLRLDLEGAGLIPVEHSPGHVLDALLRLRGWLEGRPAVGLSPGPADSSPGDGVDTPPTNPATNPATGAAPGMREARSLLRAHTRALFGPRPPDRHARILVTAPREPVAAWADGVLQAGATLLRINGGQGGPDRWEAAAGIFRARAARLGIGVRILVDLPGPKLRLFIPPGGPGVLHPRCRRDRWGRLLEPARLPLRAGPAQQPGDLPLPAGWGVRAGDDLVLWPGQPGDGPPAGEGDGLGGSPCGGNGGRVQLRVVDAGGLQGETPESFYISTGTPVTWLRAGMELARGTVGPLPVPPGECRFHAGEVFVLAEPGGALPAASCGPGEGIHVPRLELAGGACVEHGFLERLAPGDRVLLDDGRVAAVVEEGGDGAVRCRVCAVSQPGVRVRSGKGITFPDSACIPLSPRTSSATPRVWPGDETALQFALAQADAVGVSFVRCAADVDAVGQRLAGWAAAGGRQLGLVVKWETRAALANRAEILFALLRYHPAGMMIARGDLAVELGYGELADAQEELLALGQACHLPVIWATQVLESMNRNGIPTRAEITDAAAGSRAACVMLNRGKQAADAVRFLAGIIRRMEARC